MIEMPLLSLDLVRSVVQNFTIITTLLLLYNFIPDSLLVRSRLAYSAGVGIVFGIAAAISIPELWGGETASVIGFNIILVPLAAFIAGPVSGAVVAVAIIIGAMAFGQTLSLLDLMTLMNGLLLGALFFQGKSRKWFPISDRIRILLLGAGVAFVLFITSVIAFGIQGPAAPGTLAGELSAIIPFLVIVFGGTVLLGEIIGFIDRKRHAERELLAYRDHLEQQVERRTADLKKANALLGATFEATADGIVVVDRDGIIRAYNRKASGLLDLPVSITGEGAGAFLDKTSAAILEPDGFLTVVKNLPESTEQIVSTDLRFRNGRISEVFVHPQQIGEQTLGRVWSLHDITDQRMAENAIRSAYNKLSLLSNITRHDIFNQLTAIGAYLELVRAESRDLAASAHLASMRKSLDIIRFQLEFTRDYQDLGLKKPGWQNVDQAFLQAAGSYEGRGIAFLHETGDLEIFADPMIGQVFYNLIDNSLRHNERISTIRVSFRRESPEIVILYEDDGTGVLPEEKEKIFLRGFGKHTGLGMFLIKEILTITGISIRETGTYGKGVRFEIRTPPGGFRFRGQQVQDPQGGT